MMFWISHGPEKGLVLFGIKLSWTVASFVDKFLAYYFPEYDEY